MKTISTVAAPLVLMACVITQDLWSADSEKKDRPVAGIADYSLTAAEEQELITRANDGDDEAALRLARFYVSVRLDRGRALEWLRMAAERGNRSAQYELGLRLVQGNDRDRHAEGIEWLEKAEKAGDPMARRLLDEVRQRR